MTRETLSKKETSDESNFTGFDNKNLNHGNINNSQDLIGIINLNSFFVSHFLKLDLMLLLLILFLDSFCKKNE